MVDRQIVDAGVLIAFLNQEQGRYERSRELLQDAEEGVDALYVAAAVALGAQQVLSWDDRIIGVDYKGVVGIEPPGTLQPKLELDS